MARRGPVASDFSADTIDGHTALRRDFSGTRRTVMVSVGIFTGIAQAFIPGRHDERLARILTGR